MRKRNILLLALLILGLTAIPFYPSALEAAPRLLKERISIDASEDVWLFNGADLISYSDDHTTTKWTLDGSTGAVTAAGGYAMTDGNLVVADWLRIVPQATITLTMNGWLTPTGSLQPIASAGAVSLAGGTKIATGGSGGTLNLVNIGAQTITFTETTGLISAGNIVLGAGDSATLQRIGTVWYQTAASNN